MNTLISEFEWAFHDYETLLRSGAFYTLSNPFDNPQAKLMKSQLTLQPGNVTKQGHSIENCVDGLDFLRVRLSSLFW